MNLELDLDLDLEWNIYTVLYGLEKYFSVKSRVTTYARKNVVDPDPG